jgi:hypothetical protein
MFRHEWATFREIQVQRNYGCPYVKQTRLKNCVIKTVIYKYRLKLLETIGYNDVFPYSSCVARLHVEVYLQSPSILKCIKY